MNEFILYRISLVFPKSALLKQLSVEKAGKFLAQTCLWHSVLAGGTVARGTDDR